MIPSLLESLQIQFVKTFDQWVQDYLAASLKDTNHVEAIWQSISYSLQSGGKRFRPFLASLIFQSGSKDLSKIKNFCLALEMIHTYSLIHDDLPCMDNDDFRRGKPTNHKVYGEATALLAGDALLTEAFHLISTDPMLAAETKVQLIQLLSTRAGAFGMVGGQQLDMNAGKDISISDLEKIHALKTGYLIQAAATGAAIITEANEAAIQAVKDGSLQLGLSFQIKDDLLDEADNQQDHKSYLALLGKEKTIQELNRKSELSRNFFLKSNLLNIEPVLQLIEYNIQRST